MANKYIVVVGGLNMDIAGLSGPEYREKDSNIGQVTLNVGGVGHNIALNLLALEAKTSLVTVYGDDNFGQIAYEESLNAGIDLSKAQQIEGERSSIYLYVGDDKGDMVTGINDMGIIEKITPAFLAERIDFINQAEICVIDGNIPQESIEYLGENVTVPIFVDPVSVAKVGRFKNVLDKIDTFKPNEHEVKLLTDIEVTDLDSGKEAAKALNRLGVKNAYISIGAKGIICSSNEEVVLVEPLAEKIVSTNGAGDCTMATLAWARFYYGDALPLAEVGQLTQAAAAITVESSEAVSPDLNVRNVIKRAQNYYQ